MPLKSPGSHDPKPVLPARAASIPAASRRRDPRPTEPDAISEHTASDRALAHDFVARAFHDSARRRRAEARI